MGSDFNPYEKVDLSKVFGPISTKEFFSQNSKPGGLFSVMKNDPRFSEYMKEFGKPLNVDRFGCDGVFLYTFLYPEMSDEFEYVAHDFLIHEFSNLDKYEKESPLDTHPSTCVPRQIIRHHIFNMMLSAANSGSEYTKDLIIYLYKTFYRKEYQQLKRFNKLKVFDIVSLSGMNQAENNQGISPDVLTARTLVLARLMGIEIEEECNVFYSMLNDTFDRFYARLDSDCDFMERVSAKDKLGYEKLMELFPSGSGEAYDFYSEYCRFLESVCKCEGYKPSYLFDIDGGSDDWTFAIAHTYALLKKTFKNREFSKEELMFATLAYQAAHATFVSLETMEESMNVMFYGENSGYADLDTPRLFNPQNISNGAYWNNTTKPEVKSEQERVVVKELSKEEKDPLIAEVESLRRKVHQQESELKEVRSVIAGYRKKEAEKESLKSQMDEQKVELAALREYVYGLTESDRVESAESIDEMQAHLKDKRIVIVGGHSNWVSKLKNEFPNWVFVNPKVSGSLDASVVLKADHVYFFTDTISHTVYYKYLNAIRENKISFGYIHGVNIEKNIRQMYNDLCK